MRTVLLLCLLLGACTTTADRMQSWVGLDVAQLVSRWGAPDTTIGDDRGNVLTWKDKINNRYCRQSFVIGNDNVVKSWSYSGCSLF